MTLWPGAGRHLELATAVTAGEVGRAKVASAHGDPLGRSRPDLHRDAARVGDVAWTKQETNSPSVVQCRCSARVPCWRRITRADLGLGPSGNQFQPDLSLQVVDGQPEFSAVYMPSCSGRKVGPASD